MSGRDSDPRRFLVAAGAIDFPHLGDDWTLAASAGDIAAIATALCDDQGYERVLTAKSVISHALPVAIQEWLAADDLGEQDCLVIYLSSHGELVGEKFFLLGEEAAERRIATTGLHVADLVTGLIEAEQPRRLLLLVDACFAGQAAHDVAEVVARSGTALNFRESGEGVWIIAAARPRQEAKEGRFASAFTNALAYWQENTGVTQRYISLDAITDRLTLSLGPGQLPYQAHVGIGMPRFFENPRFVPNSALGVPLSTRNRIIASSRDIIEHWSPKSQGLELATRSGSLFTGRAEALRTIARFLRSDTNTANLMVVTGNPGSGKSAVLGRIVLGLPEFANLARAFEAVIDLPTYALDAVLLARAKSAEDLRAELAECLGTTSQELFSYLTASTRTVRILIDSLDESIEPRRVINTLVNPLLTVSEQLRNLRVIVGGRRHMLQMFEAPKVTLDLDNGTYFKAADLEAYVARVFREVRLERGDLDFVDGDLQALSRLTRRVADIAAGSFLVAQLVTRSLARTPVGSVNALIPEFAKGRNALEEAFRQDIASLGRPSEEVLDLLRPLSVARGAGMPRDLWPVAATAVSRLNRNYGDSDVAWLLENAGAYVLESLEDERAVYRMFHQQVAELFTRGGLGNPDPSSLLVALMAKVPAVRGARDWSAAHPYLRRHAASMAASAGEIDSLLVDSGFLLLAPPAQLLPNLGSARSRECQLRAAAYRLGGRDFWEMDAAARVPQLEICAGQVGAHDLLDELRSIPRSGWHLDWLHWRDRTEQVEIGEAGSRITSAAVGWLNEERVAVTGTANGRLKLFSLDALREIAIFGRVMAGPPDPVVRLLLPRSGNGATVIAVHENGSPRIWNLERFEPALLEGFAINEHTRITDATLVQLDVEGLALAADHHIWVIDVISGEMLAGPHEMPVLITKICATTWHGRPSLAVVDTQNDLWLMDLDTGHTKLRSKVRLADRAVTLISVPTGSGESAVLARSRLVRMVRNPTDEIFVSPLQRRIIRPSEIVSLHTGSGHVARRDYRILTFNPTAMSVIEYQGHQLLALGGDHGELQLLEPTTLDSRVRFSSPAATLISAMATDDRGVLTDRLLFGDELGRVHVNDLDKAIDASLRKQTSAATEDLQPETEHVLRLIVHESLVDGGRVLSAFTVSGQYFRMRASTGDLLSVDYLPALGGGRAVRVAAGSLAAGPAFAVADRSVVHLLSPMDLEPIVPPRPITDPRLRQVLLGSAEGQDFLVSLGDRLAVTYFKGKDAESTEISADSANAVSMVLLSNEFGVHIFELLKTNNIRMTPLLGPPSFTFPVAMVGEPAKLLTLTLQGVAHLACVAVDGSIVIVRAGRWKSAHFRCHVGIDGVAHAAAGRTSEGSAVIVCVNSKQWLSAVDVTKGSVVGAALRIGAPVHDLATDGDRCILATGHGLLSLRLSERGWRSAGHQGD